MLRKPPVFRFRLALILVVFSTQVFLITPLLIANAAPTNIITVNTLIDENLNNASCSLREAIIAANTNAAYNGCSAGAAGGDTINFGVSGTITLGSDLPAVTQTLTINGPAGGITINGVGAYRSGFDVRNDVNLSLTGLKLDKGISGYGAAIYLYPGSTLNISNSTLSNSYVTNQGGAIYSGSPTSTINIDSSTFYSNTATIYAGAEGGAIWSGGILTITNSTFYSNTANGDLCCSGGGALFVYSRTATITNATLANNGSICCGGAFYTSFGKVAMFNSTLANNTAGCCGGATFTNSPFTVTNSIIAFNTANTNPLTNNCAGTLTNGGNNIDSGTTCGWGSSNGSKSNTNPLFGPLANNGGPTLTMALLPGSPAIDGVTFNAPNGCPPTDQRGATRPIGPRCDIGAYEAGYLFLPLILK